MIDLIIERQKAERFFCWRMKMPKGINETKAFLHGEDEWS
jgi:hypothetical protein